MNEKIDTIMLTGTNDIRPIGGVGCKALVEFGDYPSIYHITKAIYESQYSNNIVMVGPALDLHKALSLCAREYRGNDCSRRFIYLNESSQEQLKENEGARIVENAKHGVDNISTDKVFFCGSDIPLVQTASIDTFLEKAIARMDAENLDWVHAYVDRDKDNKFYPGFDLKLRPGMCARSQKGADVRKYRIGNLFLAKPENVLDAVENIALAYEGRKVKESRLKSAVNFLGWKGIFKYIFRTLTIPYLEEHLSSKLGFKVGLVEAAGDVSADFDTDEELAALKRYSINYQLTRARRLEGGNPDLSMVLLKQSIRDAVRENNES